MRVATIDVGTNTVLLLVAEKTAQGIVPVEERAEITRLGEGLDRTRLLSLPAMERTLAVIDQYCVRIRALGCARVAAVATEAVRKAENGERFVLAASAHLTGAGGALNVIDGEREARLCWRAVNESFASLSGPRTVLDIGGGSTELLVGERQVESVISLPIGSVRLTERLIAHDPPDDDERARLVATIDEALRDAPRPRGTLIGIAGTVTTLSAMAQQLGSYDGARVHGSKLSRATVDAQVDWLGRTRVDDRRRAPGLEPKRADVIFAGAVILQRVMEHAAISEVLVSDRGIRWGLAYELLS